MSRKQTKEESVPIREHVFDGIEEYDQKLPNWWLFTFYIAIAFFIVGWAVYYQSPFEMADDHDVITSQMAAIDERKAEELQKFAGELDNDAIYAMSKDGESVTAGKEIFQSKCVACHGADLSATIGGVALPGVPLKKKDWLYGGKPLEIMKTVTDGSPDVTKGMIAWSSQLSPVEIAQVVSYILSEQ